MIVIKENNHIDETKLDKRESMLFLQLLDDERTRHKLELSTAKYFSWLYGNDSGLVRRFWQLQFLNHQKDIDMIDKCMLYLFNKWRIVK